jgi:hypothetical protein
VEKLPLVLMAGPERFNFFSSWLKKLVICYWLMVTGFLLFADSRASDQEQVTSNLNR